MADTDIFKDLPKDPTPQGPVSPPIHETTKPHFLNGHLIREGTSYVVESEMK